jgi:O-acetyl-ADP-ribose deacetylase (regulator of RNase III)
MRLVQGDIFRSKATTLVNPVNCMGVMGAGLALAFKKRFPAMYVEYHDLCTRGQVRPGKPHLFRDISGTQILNLPTKVDWRDQSKLELIEAGLQWFRENYEVKGIVSAAFPALGCGLGGLCWDDVLPLLEKYLCDLPIDIEVYVPQSI